MNGYLADMIGAYVTGERLMAKDTSQKGSVSDAVAQLAYHFYELRGREDGYDLDDWLRAEEQLARTGIVGRASFRGRQARRDPGVQIT